MPVDTNKKRKYKLFSTTDDRPNKEKPCAFFFSDAGCRNADKCSFSHDKMSQQTGPPSASTSAPTVTPTYETAQVETKTEKKPRKEKKVAITTSVPLVPPPTPLPAAGASGMSELQASIAAQQAKIDELRKQLEANNKPLIPVKEMTRSATKRQKPRQPVQESSSSSSSSDSDSSVEQKSPHRAHKSSSAMQISAPSSPNKLPSNFLIPTEVPSKKQAAAAPAPAVIVKEKTPAKTPRTKGREEKAQEQEEDTAFLFGIVNTALNAETPNQKPVGKVFEPKPKFKTEPVAIANMANFANTSANEVDDQRFSISNLPTSVNMNNGNGHERERSVSFSSNSGSVNGNKVNGKFSIPLGDFPFVPVSKVADVIGVDAASTLDSNGNPRVSLKDKKINVEKILATDMSKLQWGSLVAKTQSSPRYSNDYSWDKLLDQTWVKGADYGDWCKNLPPILAIDCEMCETTDPVSGVKDQCSLIRFSVIDGLNPSNVIIDELVQPSLPITECRTHIHGITEDSLKKVNYTLRHAQAALLKICSSETIIVGHSVHNDLKALHFYHKKCIDTSYLYTVENEPGASPSMRDVADHVLGDRLADAHNSIVDARASLYAASYLLVFGDNNVTPCPRANGVMLQASLLVHRIPENCSDVDIFKMISSYTNICPIDVVGVVSGSSGSGSGNTNSNSSSSKSEGNASKLNVMFTTKAHADLCFNTIPGIEKTDKSGKAQKRVYYKYENGPSGYICIRKNAH
jgi:DNA polymerase III epsilon subunit-like protein